MKILVTVGTHNQGFDALLKAVEPLAQEHELTIQSGSSTHKIEGTHQQAWFSPEDMQRLIRESDLVVSHLGCGIAREVQEAGTPTVFMCRLQSRGEHIDDHQLELKEALSGREGLAFIEKGEELSAAIEAVKNTRPLPPPHLDELLTALKAWIAD